MVSTLLSHIEEWIVIAILLAMYYKEYVAKPPAPPK